MVAPARRTDPSLQDVPRGMLAAAALLIGLASLIGLAGLATVAAALATAARRWYSRADLAPADLVGSSGSRSRRPPARAAEPGGRPNWPNTPPAAQTRPAGPKNPRRRRRNPIPGCGYRTATGVKTAARVGGLARRRGLLYRSRARSPTRLPSPATDRSPVEGDARGPDSPKNAEPSAGPERQEAATLTADGNDRRLGMGTLTVWKFDTAAGADGALDLLKRLQKEELLQVNDAATVYWQEGRKKPKTEQLHNMTGAGALGGSFWGLLFGLIFFVPLLGLAVGAAMGALAGSMSDVGIDDDFIKQVRENVTPGTSALRDDVERRGRQGARPVQGDRRDADFDEPVDRAGGEAAGSVRRGRVRHATPAWRTGRPHGTPPAGARSPVTGGSARGAPRTMVPVGPSSRSRSSAGHVSR